MTLKTTTKNIKTPKGKTQEFEMNKCVRQGDVLFATLFNLALKLAHIKISKGTIACRRSVTSKKYKNNDKYAGRDLERYKRNGTKV